MLHALAVEVGDAERSLASIRVPALFGLRHVGPASIDRLREVRDGEPEGLAENTTWMEGLAHLGEIYDGRARVVNGTSTFPLTGPIGRL